MTQPEWQIEDDGGPAQALLTASFFGAVREAVENRSHWHHPACIWLRQDSLGPVAFEAHPESVRPDGDTELRLQLQTDELEALAEFEVGDSTWRATVYRLLDKALDYA